MIEQRIEAIENKIKALKASMPVAGSLIETYFYTETSSAVYADGSTANYSVKYIPKDPDSGLGITNLYVYTEGLSSDPGWAPDNPIYLSVSNGYSRNANNEAQVTDKFTMSGAGQYIAKITASVFSTVAGDIEITLT